MRSFLKKLLVVIGLAIGSFSGSLVAQEGNNANNGEAAGKKEAPVFSYVIFSFTTLIILLIVCAPTRRPVPTEET